MDGAYLNVKNFLSKYTMIVPDGIDEFIKLYQGSAPEIIFRIEKIIDPVFHDYTISFTDETEALRQYTYPYDRESDKKANGAFVFKYKDFYVVYPDRFFNTIEDMIDAAGIRIDHGKVFYAFKKGNTKDIESFIKFKELGYNNISDYETACRDNTPEYFSELVKLIDSFSENIKDKILHGDEPGPDSRILKESWLYYFKIKNGNPSYPEILEAFNLGYDDFDLYRTAKRFGNIACNEFMEFKKYAGSFNTYNTYLKAKQNSIWTESGVLLFEKLVTIRNTSGYPDMVEAMIHYILENYIFEKMSKDAFANKIRNLISDILDKYGMQDNNDLRNYKSLLESAIDDLEKRKQLFEYNQSTGVIRIIK